jgi:uncharacterized protein (UPF0332 family)
MSVVPRELLACVQELHKTQSAEAGYRAVISRAYYAAYHAAFDFHKSLKSPGSVGSAAGRHEQLIAQLINPTIKSSDPKYSTSRRIGYLLKAVYHARVKADYYIAAVVSDAEAESAMLQAEDIFELIED